MFIVALYVPWCRHLEAIPAKKPHLIVTTFGAALSVPAPCLVLLGLLLSISGRSDKMCLLVSVSSSALPSQSGGL